MTELAITSLKPMYQDMVTNNPTKYDPDGYEKLNDVEIGVLMADANVSKPEDLFSEGFQTEQVQQDAPNERIMYERIKHNEKALEQLRKKLEEEKASLETYRADYKDGTNTGMDKFDCAKGAAIYSSIAAGLFTTVGLKGSISDFGLLKGSRRWFGGCAAAVAAFTLIGGAIDLLTSKRDKNSYLQSLPARLQNKEATVQKLESRINQLEQENKNMFNSMSPNAYQNFENEEAESKAKRNKIIKYVAIGVGAVLLGIGAYKACKGIKFNNYVKQVKDAPELLANEGMSIGNIRREMGPGTITITKEFCDITTKEGVFPVSTWGFFKDMPGELSRKGITNEQWRAFSLMEQSKTSGESLLDMVKKFAAKDAWWLS